MAFIPPQLPAPSGRRVCPAHARTERTGWPVWWGHHPDRRPLPLPAIRVKREHLVDDVVIKPTTASAWTPALEHGEFDLQEIAWREGMSEIQNGESLDEHPGRDDGRSGRAARRSCRRDYRRTSGSHRDVTDTRPIFLRSARRCLLDCKGREARYLSCADLYACFEDEALDFRPPKTFEADRPAAPCDDRLAMAPISIVPSRRRANGANGTSRTIVRTSRN